MAKSNTVISPKQGLLQIISKADADLVLLEQQQRLTESQLAAAQLELSTLASRASHRQNQRATAQSTVTQLRSRVEQEQALASLAQGTLAAGEASPNGLHKQLKRAEQYLSNIIERTAKEQDQDNLRAIELRRVSEGCQQALADLAHKHEALSGARAEAHAQLGEVEYQEVMLQVRKLEKELAAELDQVEQLRGEQESFSVEAKQRLAAWPELLGEVQTHLAYRDPTTIVLEAAIDFVTACLDQQGKNAANVESDILRRAGLGQFVDLFHLLSFEGDHFYGVLKGDGFEARLNGPLALEERRDQLNKVLQVYRESRKERGE